MAGGTNATASTFSGASGYKCGTGKAGGSMTVTIPANATVLSVYVAGWNGDNPSISISRSSGTISSSSVSPTCDSGISGSGTSYTLANTESTYLQTFTLSNVASQTTVTFSTSAKNKRFGVWGAKICYAPTSPTNTTIGSTTATLGWSDAKNVNNYEVYYSTSSTAPTASSSGSTTTSKSINLTSLTESTQYYWWVRAYDSYCKSAWVAGASFTTTASGCANKVNITNSATTNVTNGSFTVDKTGEQNACSALSVTVTPTPATHYHVASVSATNPATTGTAGSAVDNGNGTYTITYSANAKGNTTISVTFAEDNKYTLNYHDGSGDDTKTNVYEGTNLITALGTPAASCDGTSTTFMGWSTTEIGTKTNTAPSYVSASAVVNSTTAASTYYAVYAKSNGGTGGITQAEVTSAANGKTAGSYGTQSASSASGNWTGNYAWNTQNEKKVMQINNSDGNSIISPTFGQSITKIEFTYTNASGSNRTFTLKNGSNTLGSISASSNTTEGTGSADISGSYTSFEITASGALYIHSIRVTYGSAPTGYITTCCTELGTISGAVTLAQLTSGDDKGKLQATWSMASKTGLADNGIKINIYKVGTAIAVHTSAALSKDATNYTWATAPDKCTEYYATLTTIKANNTYCEGEEQGQSENITTAGYTITYNLTDDHVTKKSGDAPTSSCDGDIDAYYEAVSGYVLPSSVTVTNAGDEDENWTWNSSTGELTILAEGITGDVAVTITATVAPCDPMSNPSVTVEKTYNGATLSWSAISHAAKYKVYIYNNDDSDLESNENVTGTSYTVSSTLTGLTTYKYRVDAVSENESSYCSSYATGSFTTPDYPTVKLYYSENGELSAGVDQKILTNFTLPNTAAECNKTFIGWTTLSSYSHASAEPDPFMAKNTQWQIPTNEKCTLYAVYADVVQASTSWTRVTAVKTLTDGGTFIMGYEDDHDDAGVIVPMRNSKSNATTSAQGYILSGTTDGSSTSGTITMSSLETSNDYEIAVESGTASGTIAIKIGSNYIGKGTSGNNVKLFASKSTLTDMTPVLNSNDVIRLKFSNDSSFQYNNSGSARFTRYKNGQQDVVFYKKNVTPASTTNYALTCMGKVATPSISGVTGSTTYETDQTVTITSATAGATIKYTTDGSDPASSATTMATGSSFTLSTNGTYTIRAIAVKADMMNSDEATQISNVTIDKPYTTIASFIAAAPTNKKLVLTGAKVLGVTTNYIYIQDATAGIQLNKSSHGISWASGKTLSGYVVGTYSNNNSSAYMPRLTFTDGSHMSVTEDAAALPTATVITAGSEANICKLVKLQNVKFQSTSLSSSTVYVQKSDLDIDTVYNTFGVLNQTLPNSATSCDVTGVLIKYSGKYEIAPVSVDGITTNGAKAILPTLSPAGSTNSGSPTGVEVNEEITVTPAAGMTSTIQEDDDTPAALNSATGVTIDADKSITVTASAYYYDDNSATYYYHPDPNLTKYAIGKSAMTNGGVTVKNGDDVVTQAVSGATITLLVAPTTHYHMATISVKDADQGTVTLTEVTAGEEYTFTMPAKAVTVSATFAEDAYATVAFAKGNNSATGSAPSSISKRYVGQTATMPANTFALAAHDFAGWKYGENTYNTGASYTILAEDAAIGGKTITFDAQWTPWPDEATIYSSNISTTNADSKVIPEDEEEYDAWKIAKGSSITLTIPAGTTTIYGHLVAWNKESANVTISGSCFSSSKVLTPAADGGIANSSPFTLEEVGSTYYFKLTPDVAITENVNITFTTASDKRAVVFGVNAIYPKITLDPEEYEFGNVRANQTKSQEFTITTNENVIGALSASITNDASGKFSVGSISAGKVTVTFDPDGATSGDFTAKLKISASNAEVTADLSGTAIAAEAPEITVDKNAVAFGQVDPNASVSETIAVGLLHIDGAVSAALSGTNANKFSLSTTSLSSDGDLVVTPVTTAIGIYSATLTLSATGADNVVIPLSITVANKWAVKYTSNVAVTTGESKKVKVGSDNTEYGAYKKGTSEDATIHLPKGTQKLHLHMVAWNGEGGNVTVSGACFSSNKTIDVPANSSVSGTVGTYTFTDALALSYYHEIAIDNAIGTGGTDVTVSKSGSRIILFGVNEEGGTWEIDEDITQNDVPDNSNMELGEDVTWTVTSDKEVGDLYMKDGAVIANSAKVEANDLYFKAKAGKSNQIYDLSKITVEGSLYYDFQLCDDDLDADYWYSISVPFDVNLNSGVFQTDGTPMVNRSDFEVWEYDPLKRADTQYNGWKRSSDNMMHAGKAYLIGFNPGQPNVIRLKAAAGWKTNLFSGTSMSVVNTGGSGDHDNWNGLANPTGRYIDVNVDAQAFNNNTHGWDSYALDAARFNFVVGTAFFVQSASAITIGNTDHGNYRAPKREGSNESKCAYAVRITRNEATSFDNQIIVRASEDATSEYEQGHDMLTMNDATSKKAALLWTKNYGGKRLAIEEAPFVGDKASYELGIYAPANGTYFISVAEAKDNADLYLTYEGSIIWNLSAGAYELELGKGATNEYGLMIVRKAPQVTTGIETVTGDGLQVTGVQKIVINDHVFILRGGQMYDVTGKMVK